jgi:hypothetical protein
VEISEYTTEELLALSRGLGLGDPVMFRRPPFDEWSAEVRAEVERIGWRSLFARGLVDLDDDRAEIPELVARLCRTLCDATWMVHVACVDSGAVSAATYWATEELCAGHRATRVGNHSFTLFPAELLREVVVDVVRVADRDVVDVDAVVLSADELQAMVGTDLAPDASQVEATLHAAGLSPEIAAALAGTVADQTVTNVVCTAATDGSGEARGDIIVWIDAGHHGLWLAERVDDPDGSAPDQAAMRLAPTSAGQVRFAIIDALTDTSGVVTAVRGG